MNVNNPNELKVLKTIAYYGYLLKSDLALKVNMPLTQVDEILYYIWHNTSFIGMNNNVVNIQEFGLAWLTYRDLIERRQVK